MSPPRRLPESVSTEASFFWSTAPHTTGHCMPGPKLKEFPFRNRNAKNDRDEIGQGSFFQTKPLSIEDHQDQSRITLTLKKIRSVKGQLFFENQPLENAECQLSSLSSRIEIRSTYLGQYDQVSLIDRSKRFPRTVQTDKVSLFALQRPEKCPLCFTQSLAY
jgi:hypothetical protein